MRTALRTAPWVRAPLLLWRHPAVVAAVIGGAAVVAATAAAPGLFVASAGNAVQASQLDARCRGTVGPTLVQAAPTPAFDRAVDEAISGDAGFGRPVVTFTAPVTGATATDDRPTPLTLMARRGALAHVRRLRDGGPADGVWITEGTARRLGTGPSGTLHLRGTETTAGVAVGRALVGRPRLVLADEPTAHQDASSALLILDELRQVTERGGTVLMASHDPQALAVDRVVRLVDGCISGA